METHTQTQAQTHKVTDATYHASATAGMGNNTCYCLHSVQNSTTDIQYTHDSLAKLHPSPVALLVMTTHVFQSQPA